MLFINFVLFCLVNLEGYSQQVKPVPTGFVYTQDTTFMLNGNLFYFSGTNNYYLMYKPDAMVDDVLDATNFLGQKVIRMWAFMDGSQTHDGYSLQPGKRVYNEVGFKKIDKILDQMDKKGLKAVLVFVNYWPDFGGMPQYSSWAGGGDFYTNDTCKSIYRDYVKHLVNRTNTVNGRKYKDDPTIFSWQLTNEARGTGNIAAVTAWAKEMSDYVRSLDSYHLISMGDEGCFNYPQNTFPYNKIDSIGGYGYYGEMGTDWIGITSSPNIDYGTFHNYALDSWAHTQKWGETWIKHHIYVGHRQLNKPTVMEEYSYKIQIPWTAAQDLTRSRVMKAYADVVYQWKGAAEFSWMITGNDFEGTPNKPYYRDKWDDGFQYTITDPSTAPMLKAQAQRMLDLNIVNPPLGFSQLSPANNSLNVSAKPLLTWTNSQYAVVYKVEISRNADLSLPVVVADNIPSLNYAVSTPLQFSTKYFWRVTARNLKGQQIASNAGSTFTTQAQPPIPGSFVLNTPKGTNVAVSNTIFTWSTSSNADFYKVEVSVNANFTSPIILQDNIYTTSLTSSVALNYGTKYFIRVTAQNGSGTSVVSDSFTTQLPPAGIDNFDQYTSNASLQATYVRNSSGNTVSLSLEPTIKSQGLNALKYDYTLGNPNYAGVSRVVSGSWVGYSALSFWLRPDGSNREFTIQIKESSGEYWEVYYPLSSTSATTVVLPFSTFRHPGWYSGGNGVVDLNSIVELSLYMGLGNGVSGSGTLYVDDIKLHNGNVNQLPVANAGLDKSVTLPISSVTISGIGSDTDGTIVSYNWSQVAGPNTAVLSGGTSATLVARSLISGAYTFRLTVSDNVGATASDDVNVLVNNLANRAPVANAGLDQNVSSGSATFTLVQLNGSNSTDSDGTITSYIWSELGTQIATGVSPSVSLSEGTHNITLTVTDNGGLSATDNVIVTVTRTSSPNPNLALNKLVTVSSTEGGANIATNAVDGLSTTRWSSVYADPQWIRVDLGRSYSINNVVLKWETAYASAYQIQVSNDGSVWSNIYATTIGDGGTDNLINLAGTGRYVRMLGTKRATQWGYSLWELEVYGTTVSGTNNIPVANFVASPASGIVPLVVSLNGSSSVDPDGNALTYFWTFGDGTTATGVSVSKTYNVVGNYTVSLTVNDGNGGTNTKSSTIVVNPLITTSGNLKLQYKNGDVSVADNNIRPQFIIVNNGTTPVLLSELKIRYWYTKDGSVAQNFVCDWAAIGATNLSASFVNFTNASSTADNFAEIGFTSGAGSIPANGNSGELHTRFNKSDWSNYNEANDYSYSAPGSGFVDWSKVGLYRNGVLVWGTPPSSASRSEALSNTRLEAEISPNPSEGEILISLTANESGTHALHLLNSNGEVVLSKNLEVFNLEQEIQVFHFPKELNNGLYLLKIVSGSGNIIFKKVVLSR